MVCDSQTLVTAARQYEGLIPVGMELPAMIYLAAQIAGVDVSSKTAINSLVGNASCIACNIPAGMQWAVAISVACQIAGV